MPDRLRNMATARCIIVLIEHSSLHALTGPKECYNKVKQYSNLEGSEESGPRPAGSPNYSSRVHEKTLNVLTSFRGDAGNE